MSTPNPKVDRYIDQLKTWQQETRQLREIILACGLDEELKWGKPCYTFQGSNILIIQGFKNFCALLFTKGALLKDSKKLLEKPGENTQAARRIPFAHVQEIVKVQSSLKSYIKEAVALEKAGAKVDFKKTPEPVPEELESAFKKSPALKKAFKALTPGRQRAYILHFTSAKQSSTRKARIEKCTPKIMEGQGLNDYL